MPAIRSGLFKSSGGGKPPASGASPGAINLRKNAAAAPKTFDPGEYLATIESAAMRSKNENTSIVITLREAETKWPINLPPLWVDGPSAANGPLAAHNSSIAAQINALCGAADPYNLSPESLKAWPGKTIGVLLRVATGIGGGAVNAIEAVCSETGDDAVLPADPADPTA